MDPTTVISRLRRLFRTRRRRPSIYEHVRDHIQAGRPGLREGGETLPDEGDIEGPIRWAAGAKDGVGLDHLGLESEQARLGDILRELTAAVASPRRDLSNLESALADTDVLSIIDGLLKALAESEVDAGGVAAVGRRLATESSSRNPVKLGIALLGAVTTNEHREVFLVLGRHEEFTLYSAGAIQNTERDPEPILWELAKLVTGWGRIDIVERLSETTSREIKDWILRQGFRNDIMNEYLAYIGATTGDLVGALDDPNPDDEMLEAACDLLSALIQGGTAQDIDDYADAPHATKLLLGHLGERASTTRHLIAVDDIERFLNGDEEAWTRRETGAWPRGLRAQFLATCAEIKSRRMWGEIVNTELQSDDPGTFSMAERAARIVGVDTFELNLARVAADPIDGSWFTVMQDVNSTRLPRVLELAERSLPLTDIASGPAEELGLGPEFNAHGALSIVVQDLDRFPGQGWRLVTTALQSRVVNNRHQAIRALEAWGPGAWPREAVEAVREAARLEPDDELRARMNALIISDAKLTPGNRRER